jgi:hypothetical protein
MPIDTQSIVAIGTAIATVIMALGPLVRAFREPHPIAEPEDV